MKSKLFLIFTIVIAACSCSRMFSQALPDSGNHCFETFTIKNGLSQGMVRGIFHDHEGFMWFGTKDGLNKYDGYHVTVYRNNPADPYSLPDNYVTRMAEDENGNLWVGTSTKGFCLFDRAKENFYPVQIENGKPNNGDIIDLKYQGGKLVVFSSCITFYDVGSVTRPSYEKNKIIKLKEVVNSEQLQPTGNWLSMRPGLALSILPDNTMWFCFPDTIFCLTPDAGYTHWSTSMYSPSQVGIGHEGFCRVNALKGSNQLLFFSRKCISVFNRITGKVDYINKFTNDSDVIDEVKPDFYGNFLLFKGRKIYYLDMKELGLKKIGIVPPGVTIQGSACDYNGIFWVGTSGQGIITYDRRKQYFHTYKVPPLIYGVENSNDFIFKSKDQLAVFNPNENSIRKVNLHANAGNILDPVRYVHYQKNDDFWLNSNGSLFSYNLISGKRKKYILPLHGEKVGYISVFMDNESKHWLLIQQNEIKRRLFKLDASKIDSGYYFPIEIKTNEYSFISDFWQEGNGVFWFGTVHGLFSFNQQTKQWNHWKNIPGKNNSMSTSVIFSLCPDPKEPRKYLWIGTNGGGLDRFEFATGNCTHYTEKDGLPNNVVYGILDDEFGNLWLSTNRGLSCFNPNAAGNSPARFRNFTEDDGLAGDEFNRYEFMKLKIGELAFGGVNGLTIFKPSEVLKKEDAPNIVLTGLSVFNKPVNYKAETSIINKPISYASTIILPNEKDMFTIEFAALDFSSAEKKHYKYFLEGFNKEWIDNGNRNTATFTNLDPGKYVFHVTGCNRDGIWNEKGASIAIVITPPWWATWWFRTLAVIAFAGAAYGFYRYRLYQALKIQALRNNIASDLHDEIGSTLSSVSIASTIMQNKIKGNAPELSPLLQQISSNTDNMMEAMSDIVWAINTKNDSFENVISRMNAFAIEILEPLDCSVQFNPGPDLDGLALDMSQRKNCYLIFKEAINNAAKYAACKNVSVDITLAAHRRLVLKVKDDGIGFDNISDTNDKNTASFGGNGLINMRKRATELKGTVTITSAAGNGTEVIVEFPV